MSAIPCSFPSGWPQGALHSNARQGRAAVSTTACPNASLLTYPDVMTRIIRRVGPRATKTPRGQRERRRRGEVGHLYLQSSTRVLADHRKSALLPLPLSHRRLFRFLFRCAAPPFLPPARKKSVFPTILRRRKLSVTNVTRLDFIFVMSDIQNANRSPFSAGLPNWHPAGTATRSRGSATQMLERPNMKPCRSTLNVAPRARVLRYR